MEIIGVVVYLWTVSPQYPTIFAVILRPSDVPQLGALLARGLDFPSTRAR